MDFAGENLFRDSVISLYLSNTLLFRQMLFSFVFSFHIWGSFSEYFFDYTHIHVLFPCCTHFHEIFLHQCFMNANGCKDSVIFYRSHSIVY